MEITTASFVERMMALLLLRKCYLAQDSLLAGVGATMPFHGAAEVETVCRR